MAFGFASVVGSTLNASTTPGKGSTTRAGHDEELRPRSESVGGGRFCVSIKATGWWWWRRWWRCRRVA